MALRHRIDEIDTRWAFYRSRRIAAVPQRDRFSVEQVRVQAAMREMGIDEIYPGSHLIYPDLLRNVAAQYPHHIWGDRHHLYPIAPGMDIPHGHHRLAFPFCCLLEARSDLGDAVRPRRGGSGLFDRFSGHFKSDSGSHFISDRYLDRLRSRNIQISMDGNGRATDNIFTERLWRSLKYEEVSPNEYETPRQARDRIRNWFTFYNTKRPHQFLGYQTFWEVLSEGEKQEPFRN